MRVLRPTTAVPQETVPERGASDQAKCTHPSTWAGMCVICGIATTNDDDTTRKLQLRHVHPRMELEMGGTDVTRCKMSHRQQMLRNNKLVLVVDLDHTLLHSAVVDGMDEFDVWRATVSDDVHNLMGGTLLTKLRPHARKFLERAKVLFDLCIYTMGTREYAAQVREVLDPTGSLFSEVISRDDSTAGALAKDLDVLLIDPHLTLIIDDSPNMWPKHGDNVIPIMPYKFFNASDADDTELLECFDVLQSVHTSYYACNTPSTATIGHVSRHLRARRNSILKDCILLFTPGWASNMSVADSGKVWTTAVEVGADCRMAGSCNGETGGDGADEEDMPTHIIVGSLVATPILPIGSTAVVVLPAWIMACAATWCIQSVDAFLATR